MEATLSALKEVIASAAGQKHEPTTTELFALICSLTNSGTGALDPFVLLEILAAIAPHAAAHVVKSQFRSLAMVILQRLQHVEDRPHQSICLTALIELMIVQDTTIWETVYALQSVNALLSFLDHSHSKVRKIVADGLSTLLSNHAQRNAKQLRSYIGEFVKEVLKSCSRSEYKRSLYLFSLLESSAALLLPSDAVLIAQLASKIHSCEQPVLTAAAYKMFDCFYQSHAYSLSTEQTQQTLKFLLQSPCRSADMEANSFYFTSLASGLIRLARLDADKATLLLPGIAEALVIGCDAEFTQVHCAVSTALKRIIGAVLTESAIASAAAAKTDRSTKATPSAAATLKFIACIESLLQLKYQQTWLYILDAIHALLLKIPSQHSAVLLGDLIRKMAQMYEAIFSANIQVSTGNQVYLYDALGQFLRHMGIGNFLSLLPFADKSSPFAASKDWLLNLLQGNIKLMPCKLADFQNIILPIARKCSLATPQDPTAAALTRTRVIQLWALFPGFCYFGPTDIASAFPKLVTSLEKALFDMTYVEISGSISVGLAHLINAARSKPQVGQYAADLATIQTASSTLFPAVLKFLESLESTDHRYAACVQCVEALASVSPYPLITAVTKKLLEMLLSSTGSKDDNDDTSGWLAILLALIPYLKDNLIVIIYRTVRPLLSLKESAQKRAYLVFDALLKHHGAIIQTYEPRAQILTLLSQYLLTCSVNARHMRLRCIVTLVSTLETEGELQAACSAILKEILLCLKDCNKKSRTGAMDVLEVFINRLPLEVLAEHLRGTLVLDGDSIRSAAVTACCILVLSRRNEENTVRLADDLLPTILALLDGTSGEVTKAVLNYVRVAVSVLPSETLGGIVPEIVDASTRCVGPFRDKYSSRVRGILRKLLQKVDEDLLRPHMYDTDVSLLDYILKQGRRSRRKKESSQPRDRIDTMLDSDSDADTESEEEVEEERKPRKRVKAIRAVEEKDLGLPSTLDELMDDQHTGFKSMRVSASRKRQGESAMEIEDVPVDEDMEYKVVVDGAGRVVVQKRVIALPESKAQDAEAAEGAGVTKQGTSSVQATKKRVREPGEEYRSKKAGGDVWKRGQLEPHAYIPLDPRMLSKKNTHTALSQLGSVLRNRNKGSRASSGPKKSQTMNRKQRMAARKHAARSSASSS